MTTSTRPLRSFFPLHLVALGALLAVLPGCGTSLADLCEEVCDCEGCSDAQLEECIDESEEIEEAAEELGCEDQLDDWVSCIDSELECRDGDADTDGCEQEEQAVARCGKGSPAGMSACDQLATLCGVSSGPTECSGLNECMANCVLAAGSCDTTTVNQCGSECVE